MLQKPPAPEKTQSQMRIFIVALAVAVSALGFMYLLGIVTHPSGGSGSTSDSTTTAVDQRTCQIARDIAGSYNVTDTFAQSQARLADLYNGYGKAASPALSAGLREWVAGTTTGDLNSAASGAQAVNDACTAEGF